MFCTACGTRNPGDAHYCKQCGLKIDRGVPKITEEEFALPRTDEERAKDLLLEAFQKNAAGDIDGAAIACGEALKLRPASTDAHSLMSTLYEKQGLTERAVVERERVLELNPGSIADREKLAQLKDGTQPGRRKVTSVHPAPRPRPRLWDTPLGAVALAAGAAFVILLVGGIVVWAQGSKARAARPTTVQQPTLVASLPSQPGPGVGATVPIPPSASVPPPGTGATQPPSGLGAQPAAPVMGTHPPSKSPASTAGMVPSREVGVPPASVVLGARPSLEAANPPSEPSTVHLPDRTAPADTGPAAPAPAGPAPRSPGQIKIEIEPGPGTGRTPGPRATGNGEAGQSSDSGQQLQLAHQLQTQGNYRAAVRAYIKALDGAGDGAADIHYELGLCHQRLDEKESAVGEYNQAIAEYKRMVAAGRNADTANRGIRNAEAGIRACQ